MHTLCHILLLLSTFLENEVTDTSLVFWPPITNLLVMVFKLIIVKWEAWPSLQFVPEC